MDIKSCQKGLAQNFFQLYYKIVELVF